MFGPSPLAAATTASADLCPVTPPITRGRAPRPRCASLPRSLAKSWQPPPAPGPWSTSRPSWFFAHRRPGARAGQISPNKNMRLRCTTAAFTLSAELSGFVVWCQLARRLSLRCGSCSSARNFALGLPSDKSSRPCPCPRLVVILIASSSPTADFHRISSCPCRAYTVPSTGQSTSGAALAGVLPVKADVGHRGQIVRERYDEIGRGYARLRCPDRRIYSQIRTVVEGSTSVLNIGAGTGSYEPRDIRTVAIEPSIEMIKQRRNRANAVQARAEALPVRDKSFDASMAILTIHHWLNFERGLAEAARSARRKIVILTWDPDFEGFWLTREYFPELLELDRTIFPSISRIGRTVGRIDVQVVPIPADCTDGFTAAYWRRPEAYLDERIRTGMSSFARIEEVDDRIGQLKSDLNSGRWRRRNHNLLSVTALDLGYRLVFATLQ